MRYNFKIEADSIEKSGQESKKANNIRNLEYIIRSIANKSIKVKMAIESDYSDEEIIKIINDEVEKIKSKYFEEARQNESYDYILDFIAPNIEVKQRRAIYCKEEEISKKFDETIKQKYEKIFQNNIDNMRFPSKKRSSIKITINNMWNKLKGEITREEIVELVLAKYELDKKDNVKKASIKYINEIIDNLEEKQNKDCQLK